MKASDFMTRDVVTIAADATVADAVKSMLEHRVSGLPVVSSAGRLVGVVTEGDLIRRAELGTEKKRIRWLHFLIDRDVLAKDFTREHGRKVSEVMTRFVESVSEETPLDEIVAIMEKNQIKRLPVVRDHRIVGIISRADLLQALQTRISGADTAVYSDRAIKRHVGRVLHELGWLQRRPHISIRDGVVDLFWIEMASDAERSAARVAVENVPGVQEVRDNFVRNS